MKFVKYSNIASKIKCYAFIIKYCINDLAIEHHHLDKQLQKVKRLLEFLEDLQPKFDFMQEPYGGETLDPNKTEHIFGPPSPMVH